MGRLSVDGDRLTDARYSVGGGPGLVTVAVSAGKPPARAVGASPAPPRHYGFRRHGSVGRFLSLERPEARTCQTACRDTEPFASIPRRTADRPDYRSPYRPFYWEELAPACG